MARLSVVQNKCLLVHSVGTLLVELAANYRGVLEMRMRASTMKRAQWSNRR
jgi:hypothetical protein